MEMVLLHQVSAHPNQAAAFPDHKLTAAFSLPIGAIVVPCLFFFLHIDRVNNTAGDSFIKRVGQLDLLGAAILIPSIVMLLLALQWGGSTYAWNNSRIIGLLVGFVAVMILFIFTQWKRGDKATIPPRLFKNRNVLAACSFTFFFGAGFFALIFYIAIYFQSIKGSSATKSGIQILPLLLAVVISSLFTGFAISKTGYYTPFLIVCMAFFAIGAGLITTYDINTPMGKWFGFQVLAGAGSKCSLSLFHNLENATNNKQSAAVFKAQSS